MFTLILPGTGPHYPWSCLEHFPGALRWDSNVQELPWSQCSSIQSKDYHDLPTLPQVCPPPGAPKSPQSHCYSSATDVPLQFPVTLSEARSQERLLISSKVSWVRFICSHQVCRVPTQVPCSLLSQSWGGKQRNQLLLSLSHLSSWYTAWRMRLPPSLQPGGCKAPTRNHPLDCRRAIPWKCIKCQ